MLIEGKVIKYGDDINTDVIIPGKYTKTLNIQELAVHAMEDLDLNFKNKVKKSNILVAGFNFGCGSSREQAVLALKYSGVVCIIAKSFARIFYRNAINIGLTLIECNTDKIDEGNILKYKLGSSVLSNLSTGKYIDINPLPKIMVEILAKGGLINYIKSKNKHEL